MLAHWIYLGFDFQVLTAMLAAATTGVFIPRCFIACSVIDRSQPHTIIFHFLSDPLGVAVFTFRYGHEWSVPNES
jgi:hypothetical protein